MKVGLTFCRNNLKLIEHIRIDLDAETKEDKKDLDLLYQTGIVAVSDHRPPEILSATIYLPAKKEVCIP